MSPISKLLLTDKGYRCKFTAKCNGGLSVLWMFEVFSGVEFDPG